MPNVTFTLTPNESQLRKAIDRLDRVKNGAQKALSGALNKTMEHGRTEIKRAVMAKLNVKQKSVLKVIAIHKSTPSTLSGEIVVKRQPIPMAAYNPVKVAQGVQVQIFKGKNDLLTGAFIAKLTGISRAKAGEAADLTGGTHVGVFRRFGPKVLPGQGFYAGRKIRRGRFAGMPIMRQRMRELYGPTIVGVLAGQPGLIDGITDDLNETLSDEIDSQIQRFLA